MLWSILILHHPFRLKLERNSIRNQQISFSSNAAKIERKGDEIIITPLVEGRFVVEMKLGEKVIDQRVLFAGKGEARWLQYASIHRFL